MLKLLLQKPYLLFFALAILVTFLVRDHVFFWDTIQLGSKQAHWFYENGFFNFLLPNEIDSGHPPFFGWYLAIIWKFFGKSLVASHFAMLPFLFLFIYSIFRISTYFVKRDASIYLLALIAADPVISTQSILVSPDIVLAAFFMLTWVGILENKLWLKALGIFILCLISLRGIMVVGGLFLFELLRSYEGTAKPKAFQNFALQIVKNIWPYVPGGISALCFLAFHYAEKGWIGYHSGSPWASSFDIAAWQGLIKNIAVIGWRFLDFGRVFIWIGVLLIGMSFLRKKLTSDSKSKDIILLFFCLSLVLLPSILFHKSLSAHRYFMPLFLVLSVLLYYLVFELSENRSKQLKRFYLILMLGLLAGNFWMYPKAVSQGWDATLAHLPYYQLRDQMIEFIDKENIAYSEIGTAFPEIGPINFRDLRGRKEGFVEKDFTHKKYILYSTVMNDFTDEELALLEEEDWLEKKSINKRGVFYILYEKVTTPDE